MVWSQPASLAYLPIRLQYNPALVNACLAVTKAEGAVAPCKRVEDRWSPSSAFLGRRSHREKGSWPLVESLHTRRASKGRSTDHGYRLHSKQRACHKDDAPVPVLQPNQTMHLPQILMGASSSSRLGCCIKISFDSRHNRLISCSVSCTCLPGRPFLTSKSRSIISSVLILSCK